MSAAQVFGEVMCGVGSKVLIVGEQNRRLDTYPVERQVEVVAIEWTVIGEQPFAKRHPLDRGRCRDDKNRDLLRCQQVGEIDGERIVRDDGNAVWFGLGHPRLFRHIGCRESVQRHGDNDGGEHDRHQLGHGISTLIDQRLRKDGCDRCRHDAPRCHPCQEQSVVSLQSAADR